MRTALVTLAYAALAGLVAATGLLITMPVVHRAMALLIGGTS